MEKPSIISNNTLIPLSAASVIFFAAMWVTSISEQGKANAAQIQEVKVDISEKLDKIEAKVDRLIEKSEK